jgi:TPR repeat protein/uncharacterized caspase-like protein
VHSHQERRPWLATGAAFLALALTLGASPKPPARVALVIGVARYASQSLKNPDNDAKLISAELTKLGFSVRTLIDPKRADMMQAVDRFAADSKSADAAVIYFAGHGMELDGQAYLLPSDARFDPDTLIPSTVLAAKLREGVLNANSLRLLILDACRNVPSGAGLQAGTLQRESGGTSALVVTVMAAASGQTASDGGSEDKDSPFALALVAALDRPGMTAGELPSYLQSEVLYRTKNVQTPDLQGIWRDSSWSFTPQTAADASREAQDRRKRSEDAFWDSIRDSTDARDYTAYLTNVDEGRFTGVYRDAALKRQATLKTDPKPVPPPAKPPAGAPSAADAAAAMERARTAFARQDYAGAVKDWTLAATVGDAAAMTDLGLAAVNGYGAPSDLPAAVRWFQSAAKAGNAAGMVNLAALLLNGAGAPKDEKAGLDWLNRAAKAGSPTALEALGEIYARGERVPRDYKQAARFMQGAVDAGDGLAITNLAYWYEGGVVLPKNLQLSLTLYNRAALAGRSAAMVRLGQFYEDGDVAGQDLLQAATWYQRAVDAGNVDALFHLGALYETGRGAPRDRTRAIDFYRRAAKAGNDKAKVALQRLGVQG